MNSVLIGTGCVLVFIICAIVRTGGDEALFDIGNLITVGIVEKVANDFVEVITGLDVVKESMSIVDHSMNDIADSSESTACAVNRQADRTTDIQNRLENTSQSAVEARQTTDNLKNVISNGVILADSFAEVGIGMDLLETNVDIMSQEVEAVLIANGEIVDSIATFSDMVEGTFVQLQELAQATQEG